MTKDFTPTAGQITLHGLGFIQVKLPNNQRLHVWHPELPRRKCFAHSQIHNHRFNFTSRVLKGVQVNQLVDVQLAENGAYTRISHDGPRSEKGGRISVPDGKADVTFGVVETYEAGASYYVPQLAYHMTPNAGIVVTLIQKHDEGDVHAHSIIKNGNKFDQDFDRYQLSDLELWTYVLDALKS